MFKWKKISYVSKNSAVDLSASIFNEFAATNRAEFER